LKGCLRIRGAHSRSGIEADRFQYQGAEIHVLLIDELTHFTEVIYRLLRSRVRAVGLDLTEKYKEKISLHHRFVSTVT
jgi:hypothetical protein